MMPPIVAIVGRSQSGKTTLIEKLVPEFHRRGMRVGTIKHTHHDFDIDRPGKDSARHRDAGADTVVLAAPGKIAMVKNDHSGELNDLLIYFADMDFVVAEGYKDADQSKIEVVRAAHNPNPICLEDPQLLAIVTDVKLHSELPQFGLENVEQLADFLVKTFFKKGPGG
jgi:molybdopterin-guanine dinucleotide biosynthesis protein B